MNQAARQAQSTAEPCVEVVEPTLVTEAGHCAALFAGLQAAAPDLTFRLWVDRRAQLPGWETRRVWLRPVFHRRLRKIEAWLLYRRLLQAGTSIFVPTAGYFDLRALDFAARARIPERRVFLYFHKLRAGARRTRALQELARRQPDLELFGTSEEIVDRLRAAGFEHVRRVLPVLAAVAPAANFVAFRHLLSAGAARADKGFTKIVDLIELMAQTGSALPITVQTSGDHYGRYDEQTLRDLARLRKINYPALRMLQDTLNAAQYAALFAGAVCLQPYEPAEYADKMSSVTFDALRAGAPIVTLAGTTMARIVEQSGAGIVLSDASAPSLLQAANAAVAQYPQLHAKALATGAQYQPQASWAPLLERLRSAHGSMARAL
ncbi:MAG TPA: hypothetical protein VEI29_05005 [Burkholderiaceae bacterium]|nr:hypothetical protein [Burkholderiaceae bacterium]